MLINCTICNAKAIIQSRKQLDPKVSQLYCSCKDPLCGHTFVMDLAFSHTLSPSAQHTGQMLLSLLRSMPDAERQQVLASL